MNFAPVRNLWGKINTVDINMLRAMALILFVLLVGAVGFTIRDQMQINSHQSSVLSAQQIGSTDSTTTPSPFVLTTTHSTIKLEPTTLPALKAERSANTSDPIIQCPFPHSGSRQIRQSECSVAIDCEIGSGKWYVYPSLASCRQAQLDNNNTRGTSGSNSSYVAPGTDCVIDGQNFGKLGYAACAAKTTDYWKDKSTSTKYDCTVNGQVVGQLTSAECLSAQTNYWNSVQSQTNQSYSEQERQQRIQDCLNKFRALGAIDSSEADKCYGL